MDHKIHVQINAEKKMNIPCPKRKNNSRNKARNKAEEPFLSTATVVHSCVCCLLFFCILQLLSSIATRLWRFLHHRQNLMKERGHLSCLVLPWRIWKVGERGERLVVSVSLSRDGPVFSGWTKPQLQLSLFRKAMTCFFSTFCKPFSIFWNQI